MIISSFRYRKRPGFQFTVNTTIAGSSGVGKMTIPTVNGATYSCTVDWGDSNTDVITTWNDAAWTHTYAVAGSYTITITGKFGQIRFNNGGDRLKMSNIISMGIVSWQSFDGAFYGCSNMTIAAGAEIGAKIDTVTNFISAFRSCSSITTFPLFIMTAATTVDSAWLGCTGLTSFPLINTANVTTFNSAWSGCTNLTTFPLINTGSALTMTSSWLNCSSLTSFPLINTATVTSLVGTWRGCSSLTTFPLIVFPLATSLSTTWQSCSGLTSFPVLNTSGVTNFNSAWNACTNLATFPLLNMAAGQTFVLTWFNCSTFTVFPDVVMTSATSLNSTWRGCNSLTTFSADIGLDWGGVTNFSDIFRDVTLTTSVYDDILIDLEAVNSTSGISFNGGNSTYTGAGAGGTARAALIADHSWTFSDGGPV